MDYQNAASKVQKEHVDKLACIYVRQSTAGGVKKNIVGGRRQRDDVIKLALQLGWREANIKVIDEDQATTGSSTHGRYGYLDMLNAISKGCVGAVFSLESSRMARDSADWHCLIKLCHLTGTLVIDPDGVYDASDNNDSTLMKLKALMSEMELRLITQRLEGARRDLAKKGLLRFWAPIGYVYGEGGKLILDPKQDVQEAVRLLFSTFDRVRSCCGVANYFWRQQLKFPSIIRSGPKLGEYQWGRLKQARAQFILHNPAYSGTYVYGRAVTKRKAVLDNAGIPQFQKYSVNLPREKWDIVIQDAHAAYISWSRFIENQDLIRNNGRTSTFSGTGAARAGGALLQGLAICGKCGRRIKVKYPHRGPYPHYQCSYESESASSDLCQYVPGAAIDAAIERLFLQAVEPAQLRMSFKAFEQVEEQARQQDQLWNIHLKRAKALVDQAKERLLNVDFSNKYAFACVQEDLRKKEEEVSDLKRQHINPKASLLQNPTPNERRSIERLIRNLPLIWGAPTTDMVAKKNLLRCLIQDVTIRRDGHTVHIAARWKTLASTQLKIELRRRGCGGGRKLAANIVEFITDLAQDHTNTEIAEKLNVSGMLGGADFFTRARVGCVRRRYDLARYHFGSYPDQRKDGRYQVSAVAKILELNMGTVHRWVQIGKLDAVRDAESKIWWIKLSPEHVANFKQTIRRSNRS